MHASVISNDQGKSKLMRKVLEFLARIDMIANVTQIDIDGIIESVQAKTVFCPDTSSRFVLPGKKSVTVI